MSEIQSEKKIFKNPDVPHSQRDALKTLLVHLIASFGHIISITPE